MIEDWREVPPNVCEIVSCQEKEQMHNMVVPFEPSDSRPAFTALLSFILSDVHERGVVATKRPRNEQAGYQEKVVRPSRE